MRAGHHRPCASSTATERHRRPIAAESSPAARSLPLLVWGGSCQSVPKHLPLKLARPLAGRFASGPSI